LKLSTPVIAIAVLNAIIIITCRKRPAKSKAINTKDYVHRKKLCDHDGDLMSQSLHF
jgi:hypothetical protein